MFFTRMLVAMTKTLMNSFNLILICIFLIGCEYTESQNEEHNSGSRLSLVKTDGPFEELISLENVQRKIDESGKPGLIYFGARIDVNSKIMRMKFLMIQKF